MHVYAVCMQWFCGLILGLWGGFFLSCKVAVWGRASPSEHRRRNPPPRGSRHPLLSVRLSHLPATRHPHGAIVPLATTASRTPLCPPGTIPCPARARQVLPQGRRQPQRFSYSLGFLLCIFIQNLPKEARRWLNLPLQGHGRRSRHGLPLGASLPLEPPGLRRAGQVLQP